MPRKAKATTKADQLIDQLLEDYKKTGRNTGRKWFFCTIPQKGIVSNQAAKTHEIESSDSC